jgi:hypothetical protein
MVMVESGGLDRFVDKLLGGATDEQRAQLVDTYDTHRVETLRGEVLRELEVGDVIERERLFSEKAREVDCILEEAAELAPAELIGSVKAKLEDVYFAEALGILGHGIADWCKKHVTASNTNGNRVVFFEVLGKACESEDPEIVAAVLNTMACLGFTKKVVDIGRYLRDVLSTIAARGGGRVGLDFWQKGVQRILEQRTYPESFDQLVEVGVNDVKTAEYIKNNKRFAGDIVLGKRTLRGEFVWLFDLLEEIDDDLIHNYLESLLDAIEFPDKEDSRDTKGLLGSAAEDEFIKDNEYLKNLLGEKFFNWLFHFMDGGFDEDIIIEAEDFKRLRLVEMVVEFVKRYMNLSDVSGLTEPEREKVNALIAYLLDISRMRAKGLYEKDPNKKKDVYVLEGLEEYMEMFLEKLAGSSPDELDGLSVSYGKEILAKFNPDEGAM